MNKPDNKTTQNEPPILSCIVNEKGEEVPITDEMVSQSLDEIKLQSMGVHTGINKIITDEMLSESDQK